MRPLVLIALGLTLAAETPAAAAAAPPPADDANDCAIFVALGKKLLSWGSRAPDARQFMIFYRPEGNGYVEQCPWRRLGVKPLALTVTAPDLSNVVYFTEPAYNAAKTIADVAFVTEIKGPEGKVGFISQVDCRLQKLNGHWRVQHCAAGLMT